jgi:hypothetical protein
MWFVAAHFSPAEKYADFFDLFLPPAHSLESAVQA